MRTTVGSHYRRHCSSCSGMSARTPCPSFKGGEAIAEEPLHSEVASEGGRLEVAWANAAELGVLRKKGYQVNLNRRLGALDGASTLLERWSSVLMACRFVAVGVGMLAGSAPPRLPLRAGERASRGCYDKVLRAASSWIKIASFAIPHRSLGSLQSRS